MNKSEHKLCHN